MLRPPLSFARLFIIIGIVVIGIGGIMFTFKQIIPSTHLKIAIVDGERLKEQAAPFAVVNKIVQDEFEKVKEEFTPHQVALEKVFESIRAEKDTKKAQKKKEEFDKKRGEIEQIFLKKQEYLHKIQTHLSTMLNETVLKVIQETAKKHNIHIVHNRFVEDKLLIFYHDPVLDLTDTVIKAVNMKLKNITIPSEIAHNEAK